MYTVHAQAGDKVIELMDVPRCDGGAPLPAVFATEHRTCLAYYLLETDETWDGTSVKIRRYMTQARLAIVSFKGCYAHMFGPPSDEAFIGHPLASRGLHPYGAFRVEASSWLRSLEQMNSVHRHHSAATFHGFNHYIFAFHDSTFECIAQGFEVEAAEGSIMNVLTTLAQGTR